MVSLLRALFVEPATDRDRHYLGSLLQQCWVNGITHDVRLDPHEMTFSHIEARAAIEQLQRQLVTGGSHVYRG